MTLISIDYTQVVMHLRQHCPTFEGRVRLAADLVTGVTESHRFTPPAAYVAMTGMTFGENDQGNTLVQEVEEQFTVWVELAVDGDRSGAKGIHQITPIVTELIRALVNWNPLPARASYPVEMVGVENIQADSARQIWALDFKLPYWITHKDGWQAPQEPWTGTTGDIQGNPQEQMFTPTGATGPAFRLEWDVDG